MTIDQVNRLLHRGFKFRRLEAWENQVLLTLESPEGQANHGKGADVSEAVVDALIGMMLKTEEYLVTSERDVKIWKEECNRLK